MVQLSTRRGGCIEGGKFVWILFSVKPYCRVHLSHHQYRKNSFITNSPRLVVQLFSVLLMAQDATQRGLPLLSNTAPFASSPSIRGCDFAARPAQASSLSLGRSETVKNRHRHTQNCDSLQLMVAIMLSRSDIQSRISITRNGAVLTNLNI